MPASALGGHDGDVAVKINVHGADGPLTAGEKETVTIAVTNTGSATLYRAYATLESQAFFLRGRGILLGAIEPGKTREWPIEIDVPTTAHFGRVDAVVALHDATGFIARSSPVLLAVEEAPRARLAHRVRVESSEARTEFTIVVEFENRGDARASDVKAFLRHPESERLELVEGSATIERLDPGAKAEVTLTARLLASTEAPQEVDLVISEADFRLFLEDSVDLVASADFGPWKSPPDVELESIVETDEGYALIAKATDESGIATVLGHRDGNQSSYVHTGLVRPTMVRISIPWRPEEDVKTVTVVATDSDGLTTRLDTEL